MQKIAIVSIFLALTMTTNADTNDAQRLLAKADSVFQSSQYDQAEVGYRSCLDAARELKNPAAETEALAQIARCRLLAHDLDGAVEWLAQAEEIATPDEPLGWARYLGVKGRLQWQQDSLPAASATFQQMFSYCIDRGMTDRAIDAVHMVAIVGSRDEQIEWGLKGIELAEETGTNRWLGPLWNNLAITYSDIPDWDKCVGAFKKAREYHWQYGNEMNKLYADYHIGYALRMKRNHDEALTWLRPALAWAERLENNDVVGQASEDIGEITIAAGDTTAGLEYLRRALDCYQKEGYPDFAPEIFSKLKTRIAELEK